MKNISLLLTCVLFAFTNLYGQEKERKYKDNNVAKIFITAKEYKEGKQIKKMESIAEIHITGKTEHFISYHEDGTVKSKTTKIISEDGLRETSHTKDKDGNITNTVVYAEDPLKKSLQYFQINAAKDTVVRQVRYYNMHQKDSILYTKIRDGKEHVSGRWSYDKHGEELLYESLKDDGTIDYTRSNIYKVEGLCKIFYNNTTKLKERKVCREPNKEITHFYEDRDGFLYGVKILIRNKGRKVTELMDNGLVKSETYYDKKNNILTQILYQYSYRI